MKRAIIVLCLIFISSLKYVSSTFTPVLKINQGKLRGLRHFSGQYRYYSIPYAISERFQPPREPPKWEGIFDAISQFRPCAQRVAFVTIGQEDCLELDIYTPQPAQSNQKYPVLVFFHGGAFYYGSKSHYDPEYLVAKGIVAITVNYRLGVLGFLCANGVANLGLKDQTAALKWIQTNIAAFGGDPGRVIISGQSAGGGCAGLHLLSESSAGLFHGAILMSGHLLTPWAINLEPLRGAFADASKLGKVKTEADIYNVFAKASVNDLMSATLGTSVNTRYLKYSPCIDSNYTDPFFRDAPYNIVKSGKFNKVPVMMGVANVEGMLFYGLHTDSTFKQLEEGNFADIMLPSTFSWCSKEDRMNISTEFRRHYFKGQRINRRMIKAIADYYSDWLCYSTLDAVAKLLARYSAQRVYTYVFDYEGGRNFAKQLIGRVTNLPGTSHSDDLLYIFKPGGITFPLSDDDRMFIERFTTMLANFVKYGNPIPQTNKLLPIRWPAVTANDNKVMRLDRKLSITPLPQELRGDFFYNQLCKYGLQGYVPCESEMACDVD